MSEFFDKARARRTVFKRTRKRDDLPPAVLYLEWLGSENKRRVLDAEGKDVYLPHIERMALPILFIHGEKNACFKPESTERTLKRLSEANGRQLYERHVIPGHGHLDCIFGKNAFRDVYPVMLKHLEATAYISEAGGRG